MVKMHAIVVKTHVTVVIRHVTGKQKWHIKLKNYVVTSILEGSLKLMLKALCNTMAYPPKTSRASGRPKSKRRESQFQDKKIYHCGRCNEVGHTRRSCRNPNPSWSFMHFVVIFFGVTTLVVVIYRICIFGKVTMPIFWSYNISYSWLHHICTSRTSGRHQVIGITILRTCAPSRLRRRCSDWN